jgi:hypothetical protein
MYDSLALMGCNGWLAFLRAEEPWTAKVSAKHVLNLSQ